MIDNNKHGGKREGSGRKAIEKELTTYQKSLSLLDDNSDKVIQTILELLDDDSKTIRLKAAEILLKKIMPDRKQLDIELPEDLPINILLALADSGIM